ncbi:MAG: carboxymuconolactone decarboxylase family protein [Candidatus Margulisbacteria bacterium]|nr:carboxymuconolactone decarboxylase family protein [Candidatus Margulisiibacteriota bacterium]
MLSEKPWYVKDSKIGDALENLKAVSNEDSALDTKTKELLKFAVASVFRCEHCTHSHLKKALAAGASRQEITETLLIVSTQAAATQMNWNKEVFEKYLGER